MLCTCISCALAGGRYHDCPVAPSLVDAAGAMPSMFLQVQPLDDAAGPPLPSSEMVIVMATVVSKLIDEDARDNVTKFCALTPPAISVRSYLERIGQYADCSRGASS